MPDRILCVTVPKWALDEIKRKAKVYEVGLSEMAAEILMGYIEWDIQRREDAGV